MDISAPWPGRVAELHVGPGARVSAEQELVTIESMKMLMPVVAPRAGQITRVAVEVEAYVDEGELLMELSD